MQFDISAQEIFHHWRMTLEAVVEVVVEGVVEAVVQAVVEESAFGAQAHRVSEEVEQTVLQVCRLEEEDYPLDHHLMSYRPSNPPASPACSRAPLLPASGSPCEFARPGSPESRARRGEKP
jgi:hypothetical protein